MIHESPRNAESSCHDAPVYIGGLSTKMTVLYDGFARETPRRFPGFEILRDMEIAGQKRRLRGRGGRRRRGQTPIVSQPGAIFALSSGMMTEHTVSNNFARGFLQNPKNAILFVGYADPDSPAAAIRRAAPGDLVTLDPARPPEQLNCRVGEFDFSGHANRDELLDYALRLAPEQIHLVHGDLPASEWFLRQLQEKLPGTKTTIPEPGKAYNLSKKPITNNH